MEYLDYITKDGDTFDIVALDFYNDEYKATVISDANPKYADTIIFRAGVQLKIPIIEIEEVLDILPPWRRI